MKYEAGVASGSQSSFIVHCSSFIVYPSAALEPHEPTKSERGNHTPSSQHRFNLQSSFQPSSQHRFNLPPSSFNLHPSSLSVHPSSFKGRIWLIGGTAESAQLAHAIAFLKKPCTISVTTKSACTLYPTAPTLQVWVVRFNLAQIEEFLQQQQIVAILDASHPYAVEISQMAIAASQKLQIPYLRYERPRLEQGQGEPGRFDSFESLLTGNYLQGKRVLLTVGYRPLHLFQPWQERATLFARILPSAIAIEAATGAGFTPDRLICLRPPISANLEKALWQQWQISLVVTKASGTPGGEDIKRTVAAQLGIPLIAISRPIVEYPQQTSNLSQALEFCLQHSPC